MHRLGQRPAHQHGARDEGGRGLLVRLSPDAQGHRQLRSRQHRLEQWVRQCHRPALHVTTRHQAYTARRWCAGGLSPCPGPARGDGRCRLCQSVPRSRLFHHPFGYSADEESSGGDVHTAPWRDCPLSADGLRRHDDIQKPLPRSLHRHALRLAVGRSRGPALFRPDAVAARQRLERSHAYGRVRPAHPTADGHRRLARRPAHLCRSLVVGD